MIFLDLDGPLLDVSEKYFAVYSKILANHGFESLSKESYWEAKRNRVPDASILTMTGAREILPEFQYERRRCIESDEFLVLDNICPGAKDVLDYLRGLDSLALVTLRSQPRQLHSQLLRLDLLRYFAIVLSSGSDEQPRWAIKFRLISDYLYGRIPKVGIIIGDTETDILAGKHLGLITIGCINGIRAESLLREIGADYLLNDIRDLPVVISGLYRRDNAIS